MKHPSSILAYPGTVLGLIDRSALQDNLKLPAGNEKKKCVPEGVLIPNCVYLQGRRDFPDEAI